MSDFELPYMFTVVTMLKATDECYTISTLEEFDERKVVGHGAYGAVYEVRMNGTPCIAKRVHDILVGQRGNAQVGRREIEAVRSKFQAECKLLGKLKHPNIVQFLGIYHDGDDDVLVMEYMPHGSSQVLGYLYRTTVQHSTSNKAVHPSRCDQWAASPSFPSPTHHPS